MDFSKVNIPNILRHSIPKRFQDMSPSDFEDFIAQLFLDLGYKVKQTAYTGDFGADLIASKDNRKIAIQVKRYRYNNNVGVKDINQVIGSKEYHKCNASMIITTSSYTKAALKLVKQAMVEKWDWDLLQKTISDVYLDGKDIYSYYPDVLDKEDENYTIEIFKVKYNQDVKQIGSSTIVFAKLKNNCANADMTVSIPTLITRANRQVRGEYWYSGYFQEGVVYSGASVDVAFIFKTSIVRRIGVGDRFIFTLHVNGSLKTLEVPVTTYSFGGCYVTTMCFGKNSKEYAILTSFRDNWLIKRKCGRKLIQHYYRFGGILVGLLGNIWIAKLLSKAIIKLLTLPISIFTHFSNRPPLSLPGDGR